MRYFEENKKIKEYSVWSTNTTLYSKTGKKIPVGTIITGLEILGQDIYGEKLRIKYHGPGGVNGIAYAKRQEFPFSPEKELSRRHDKKIVYARRQRTLASVVIGGIIVTTAMFLLYYCWDATISHQAAMKTIKLLALLAGEIVAGCAIAPDFWLYNDEQLTDSIVESLISTKKETKQEECKKWVKYYIKAVTQALNTTK